MDGVGRVGGQEGVDGGNPQMGVDGGGDRHMGTNGGGGGTRQRCKNRRQKINGSSLVSNTTKVTNSFLVSRYCIVSRYCETRWWSLPNRSMYFVSTCSGR
jgi:hypothetical protein